MRGPNGIFRANLTTFSPQLSAYCAGDCQESASDEEAVAGVMKSLRTLFADVPEPVGAHLTRWGVDRGETDAGFRGFT